MEYLVCILDRSCCHADLAKVAQEGEIGPEKPSREGKVSRPENFRCCLAPLKFVDF